MQAFRLVTSLGEFRGESFNWHCFVASSLTNKFVTVRLPRGWLLGGGVELVVE